MDVRAWARRQRVPGRRRSRATPSVGWVAGGAVIVLTLAVIGVHNASLEIMLGGRAFVHGEGRWSKGQQDAVFHLDRYAETGAREHLVQARAALDIPLGDRQARLALQGPAYDYEAAREGLLRGQNHPADIPTMIWLFEHFENAPYLDRAVDIWASADAYIVELASIADRLQALWNERPVDRAAIVELRPRISEIDEILRAHETRFSATFGAGLRTLRTVLGAVSAVTLGALAVGAVWIFYWATGRIAASERKFWASFAHAPVGVAMISDDGRFTEVNDQLCRILGHPRRDLVGAPVERTSHPDDREPTPELLGRARAAGDDGVTVEKRYLRADGEVLWGKLTLTGSPDGHAPGQSFIGVLQDVSEEHRLAEELSYQATHDALTGQLNRWRFETELREVLEHARAHGSRHVLAFVDLDQFKVVNDTCGHHAGDVLLRQVSEVMHDALRTSDVLARLGGDEFAFILRDCDRDAGHGVAEKVRAAVAEFTFTWQGRSYPLSCSMGLIELDGAIATPGEALQMADGACYRAKERGRDRVQVHSRGDERFRRRAGKAE